MRTPMRGGWYADAAHRYTLKIVQEVIHLKGLVEEGCSPEHTTSLAHAGMGVIGKDNGMQAVITLRLGAYLTQHVKSAALIKLQVDDGHVRVILLNRSKRLIFGVHRADDLDPGNICNHAGQ